MESSALLAAFVGRSTGLSCLSDINNCSFPIICFELIVSQEKGPFISLDSSSSSAELNGNVIKLASVIEKRLQSSSDRKCSPLISVLANVIFQWTHTHTPRRETRTNCWPISPPYAWYFPLGTARTLQPYQMSGERSIAVLSVDKGNTLVNVRW